MATKFYTLKVTLCNDEVMKWQNLTDEQEKEMRSKIWVEGLRRRIDRFTFELINPLIIKSALVIEQDGQIGDGK